MTQPYRIGFCPQCGAQTAVQNTDGQWNSFKANWRQADMIFPDGHKVRTQICSTCLENPDFEKIMASILHQDSQACDDAVKNHLRFVVKPRGLKEDEILTGGKVFRKALVAPEEGKSVMEVNGEVYEEVEGFSPYETTERGLPVKLESWGHVTGGMRKF